MEMAQLGINKILNESKKIELRLFDEERRKLRLADVIEFYCAKTKESVLCLVSGLVVFETFNELIDMLPPDVFGYLDRNEVKVRMNRLYTIEEQVQNNVVGIFITPIKQKQLEKEDEHNYFDRQEHVELEILEKTEVENAKRDDMVACLQNEENTTMCEVDAEEPISFEFVSRDCGYER